MKPTKTLLVLGISATLGGCMSLLTTAVPIIWEASKSEILMGSIGILAQVLLGTNKTSTSSASSIDASAINDKIQTLNGKASAPQTQQTAQTESKDLSQLLQLVESLTQQVLKQPTLENKSAALSQYQPQIRTLLTKYQADIPKNTNGLDALEEGLPVYLNYSYRQVGQNEMKNLTNGTVLRDGDHYKITFMPQEDGYVYIFQTDSAGKVYQLFPMAGMKDIEVNNYNPVKAKVTYTLPATDKSFYLDNQTGEEKIYFIATKQPDQILEQQMAVNLKTTKFSARGLGGVSSDKNPQQTAKAQPSDQKLLDIIRARAPAAVISDAKETKTHVIKDDDGKTFNLTYQKLDGWCGQQKGCASVISFRHESR